MKNILTLLVATFFLCSVCQADGTLPGPYDETANAGADVAAALSAAKADKKDVLLIFGANWCKDCLELDRALKGQSASLMQKKFVVVKINVGQFDRNLDLASEFGNPIKKGIPAAVLLHADRSVIYATRGGELADARHMGEQGIYDFFNKITDQHNHGQ